MHLVNKEDDLPVRAFHLIQHALQPLFKLAAIFCACNQCAHIERHERAAFKALWHIAIGNPQSEPFGNRGFARARLTDQRGIVLGAPSENLHRTANFLIAPDYRIKLTIARGLRQIAGELLHRVIIALRVGAVCFLAAAKIRDRLLERWGIQACIGKRPARLGRARQCEREQQSLYGNKAVARFLGQSLSRIEDAHHIIVEAWRLLRAAARDSGDFRQILVDPLHRFARVTASTLDQPRAHAFLILEQGLRQMRGRDPLMVHPDRNGLRRLQKAF